MRINTNVSSLTAQEANSNTNNTLASSLEKLSTGLKINKASDDASGLAIADKLRTEASGLSQSIENGNSAVALTQIADKAMAEQSNILDTVKSKLIQASTDTTSDEGRAAIAKDIDKLLEQLNNIASQTKYNGTLLLQASAGGGAKSSLTFQMGVNSGETISTTSGTEANVSGLGLDTLKGEVSGVSGFDSTAASTAMAVVDSALNTLNGWRADFGSTQNQLESAIRNQMTQKTNILAAESVIRDVDYAEESANFNKQNIISQAGSYAISQANNVQQNILRLLQ